MPDRKDYEKLAGVTPWTLRGPATVNHPARVKDGPPLGAAEEVQVIPAWKYDELLTNRDQLRQMAFDEANRLYEVEKQRDQYLGGLRELREEFRTKRDDAHRRAKSRPEKWERDRARGEERSYAAASSLVSRKLDALAPEDSTPSRAEELNQAADELDELAGHHGFQARIDAAHSLAGYLRDFSATFAAQPLDTAMDRMVEAAAESLWNEQQFRDPSGDPPDDWCPPGEDVHQPPPREPLLWAQLLEEGRYAGDVADYRADARASLEAAFAADRETHADAEDVD